MKVLLPEGMSSAPDPIAVILQKYKTIAVVGLSSKEYRASYGVSVYMKHAGYRIIGVNPNEDEVFGERCYARLEDVPEPIEIVDIFRRSEEVPPIVESAIAVCAKVIWMQESVEHAAAGEEARAAGLVVVMDACILKEHRKMQEQRKI